MALVHVSAFTNHVSQLFETVAKVLCSCGKPSGKTTVGEKDNVETDLTSPVEADEKPLMDKLADEWREFFSNSACSNLLGLLSTLTGIVKFIALRIIIVEMLMVISGGGDHGVDHGLIMVLMIMMMLVVMVMMLLKMVVVMIMAMMMMLMMVMILMMAMMR